MQKQSFIMNDDPARTFWTKEDLKTAVDFAAAQRVLTTLPEIMHQIAGIESRALEMAENCAQILSELRELVDELAGEINVIINRTP